MAILQALFALISKSAAKILNAVFRRWSSRRSRSKMTCARRSRRERDVAFIKERTA